MDNDKEQLNLLAIFHFVVGGLAGLFACIPIIHLLAGIALIIGTVGSDEPGMAVFGLFFALFAGAIILCGWALAIAIIYAGTCLKKQVRYQFCLVVAAIACIFMPFGTVLGVFTIVVLMRPSVKELFQTPAAAASD